MKEMSTRGSKRPSEMLDFLNRILQMQREIDEYRRFYQDLLIMLVLNDETKTIAVYGTNDEQKHMFDAIWDGCYQLIKKNKELVQNLKEEAEKSNHE